MYLLSLHLGGKLLGQGVCICSALTDEARPFSKVVPFVFPSTGIGVLVAPHPCQCLIVVSFILFLLFTFMYFFFSFQPFWLVNSVITLLF